jgi:23S rRNA U2552 (ribose-2'-O)-methylase RlmE/FtsJ
MISENIFEVPVNKNLDKLTKIPIVVSSSINQPSLKLGFQYFIHRKKNEMEITNNLSNFYYIVNPYEHKIEGYDDDLLNISIKYFNIKAKDFKILSRAFYKLWEIFFIFDLVKNDKTTYAALAEGPGAFIQSFIHFKKKFYSIKKDRIFGVTIHPESKKDISMAKQFLNFYNTNENKKLVNIHRTKCTKDCLKYEKKKIKSDGSKLYKSYDNGDLTNVKTISNFKSDIKKSKKYADLVTADGGFVWDDENYQEMEAYKLILGQMVGAIRVQSKGGHFVLKIFETFTNLSLKMIYLVSSFYNKCYVYKPFYSRTSNSEKYVIFKDFKYDQTKDSKFLDSKISLFEEILKQLSSSDFSDKFLNDILPDMELPKDFVNVFVFLNTKIANKQQIMINHIVSYIKENNYYGEKYHNYKKVQIDETKKWSESYFPDEKEFSNTLKSFKKSRDKILDYNSKEIKLFVSKMS